MKRELLGVDKIDAVLNEFLEEFDTTAEMGMDFAYWCGKSKIEYTIIMPENSKDYFMTHLSRLAPDIKCDSFLAAFLHEVGHAETNDCLEPIEEAYCLDIKEEIEQDLRKEELSEKDKEKLHYQYFNLPDEHEATMWAINYMRNNSQKIAEFWNKLQKVLMNFYKVNKIEVM